MSPYRRVTNKHLGELLLEKKVIDKKQLDDALKLQERKGGLIGSVLVSLGYAKENEIAQALTAQYGFPYLPLENYEVDSEVIKLIPENVMKQYCLVPIDLIGVSLTIAMANPLNSQAIEDIELITKCNVQAFVSTATDIKGAIEKHSQKQAPGKDYKLTL